MFNRFLVTFFYVFIISSILFAADKKTDDYVHYRLGVKYKGEKKYDQAVEEFRRVLATYPDNYNAYMHLAEIRETEGRLRLSIYNLKNALSYNPGWSKAQKMLADTYNKDGQYQNAIKVWQEYLQTCDPGIKDSVQTIIEGLLLATRGSNSKANRESSTKAVVDKSVASNEFTPDENTDKSSVSPVKLARRAKGTIKYKDNKEAEIEFKSGVQAYTDGVATNNSNLLNSAVEHLRNALKLNPKHTGAYYYAGLIRRRLGQNKMALINFEKALTYPELGYNAHFYLGKIYGEDDKFFEAIKHLERYISKTDYETGIREAKLLINRFNELLRAMKADTVKIDYEALSRTEMHREMSKIPKEAEYAPMEIRVDSLLSLSIVDTLTEPGEAMLLGVMEFNKKRFDNAIDEFNKVLLVYPNGDVACRSLYDIGICNMKLKNYASAEKKFSQLLSRFPAHDLASNACFFIAMSMAERKESQKAEGLYRKFIQKYRKHALTGKAYENLGDVYIDLMDTKKAIDAFKQAFALATNSIDKVHAQYKVGKGYSELKNPSRAIVAFGEVIKIGEKNNIFERVPDSYYHIGDAHYKQHNYDKAFKYYKQATQKYTGYQDTPWGLFQMASIYKNKKEYKKAIATFKMLIKKYSDDYWARQAQFKLDDTVWEYEYRSVLK